MPSKIYLILRSERSERLEERRIVLQRSSAALTISLQPLAPEDLDEDDGRSHASVVHGRPRPVEQGCLDLAAIGAAVPEIHVVVPSLRVCEEIGRAAVEGCKSILRSLILSAARSARRRARRSLRSLLRMR